MPANNPNSYKTTKVKTVRKKVKPPTTHERKAATTTELERRLAARRK